LAASARPPGKHIGAEIELSIRAEFPDYSFLDNVVIQVPADYIEALLAKMEKRQPINVGLARLRPARSIST